MHARLSLALTAIAVTAADALAACQLVVTPSQDFSPSGVVELASFPDLDPPPVNLTAAGAGLFFVQGETLYSQSTDGAEPPRALHVFSGVVAPLAFDGADALLACDATGDVFAVSVSTFASLPAAPGAAAGCTAVANSTSLVAYVAQRDGGGADGGALVSIAIVNSANEDAGSYLDYTLTPSDVGVIADDASLFGTLGGDVVALGGGAADSVCRLERVGETLRPKLVVVSLGDGGAAIIARGQDDGLREVDPQSACCTPTDCAVAPTTTAAQAGQGDFTVFGDYLYWSNANTVLRQPVDALLTSDGVESVATFGDANSFVASLAVNDAGVFAVVGARILAAPGVPPR